MMAYDEDETFNKILYSIFVALLAIRSW